MLGTTTKYQTNAGKIEVPANDVVLNGDSFCDGNGKFVNAEWSASQLPQDVPVNHEFNLVGKFSFTQMLVSSKASNVLDFKSSLVFENGFAGNESNFHFLQVITREIAMDGVMPNTNHLCDSTEGGNQPYLDPPFFGYIAEAPLKPSSPFFHSVERRRNRQGSLPEFSDAMGFTEGVEFLHSIAFCPLDLEAYLAEPRHYDVVPLLTFKVAVKKVWDESKSIDLPMTIEFAVDRIEDPVAPYRNCAAAMEKWTTTGRSNRTFSLAV